MYRRKAWTLTGQRETKNSSENHIMMSEFSHFPCVFDIFFLLGLKTITLSQREVWAPKPSITLSLGRGGQAMWGGGGQPCQGGPFPKHAKRCEQNGFL